MTGDLHEQVPVSALRAGDTVLMGGVLKTVCSKDLKRCPLMGATLWGDSHRLGRDLITRVVFEAELRRRQRA